MFGSFAQSSRRLCSGFGFNPLLHEDGHQDGVEVGYTRVGTKPCLHPLMAVLREVRLVASFWLRPGHSACANNVQSFFLDLWENLPRHLQLRVVRADSGFCIADLFLFWETLQLKFVVAARLTQPLQRLIKKETTQQFFCLQNTNFCVRFFGASHIPPPRSPRLRVKLRPANASPLHRPGEVVSTDRIV